jgi:putative protease
LHTGADAVFLGLDCFNARSRAENFTIDDLKDLVRLAQSYDMKVLVTVNILLKQLEFLKLIVAIAWTLFDAF